MYDPLPPLDSINIYKRPVLSTPSRLLADASPLSMFFQSLLPSFNIQGGNFVAPEVAAAAAAAVAAEGRNIADVDAGEAGAAGIAGNHQQLLANFDLLNNPMQIIDEGNFMIFSLNPFEGLKPKS